MLKVVSSGEFFARDAELVTEDGHYAAYLQKGDYAESFDAPLICGTTGRVLCGAGGAIEYQGFAPGGQHASEIVAISGQGLPGFDGEPGRYMVTVVDHGLQVVRPLTAPAVMWLESRADRSPLCARILARKRAEALHVWCGMATTL